MSWGSKMKVFLSHVCVCIGSINGKNYLTMLCSDDRRFCKKKSNICMLQSLDILDLLFSSVVLGGPLSSGLTIIESIQRNWTLPASVRRASHTPMIILSGVDRKEANGHLYPHKDYSYAKSQYYDITYP